MPQLSTLSAAESAPRLQQDQQPGLLPRTRGGDLKRRLTFEEKLVILDPYSDAEKTQERLMAFMNVFAFRTTGGIITKAGGGPSDWAALRGPIEPEQVARHLLADRLLPIFNPQWVGSRSPSTTCLVGLDVDAARPPEPILRVDGIKEILAFGYSDLKAFGRDRDAARKRADKKVPFAARCLLLEDALRRLGPNPDDPREVLKQPTPSGGLHYYVFLDRPYFLTQVYALLIQAGLRHLPGQIEFFPSSNRALRLPFGHVPGQVNDPQVWIKFIDNFLDGQIRQFSLEEMYDGLNTNPVPSKSDGPILNDPGRPKVRRDKPKTHDRSPALGLPKAKRINPGSDLHETSPRESDLDLYGRLVNVGCTSLHEAEELFRLGILETGTRNSALKQLAAHFIWGVHKTAEEAAEILTNWALDPRHESKDIRDDLARGTNKVANQIQDMCRWYAREKKARRPAPQPEGDPRDCFAPAELDTLVPVIQSLPVEERADQSRFFLSILAYAKRNGQPREDGSGWEVAVAIKEVVRKWEGCRGRSRYLDRMDRAYVSGLLVMIREKLQVAGGKGRARTYLLAVPLVDQSEWTICRDDALARLTTPGSYDQAGLQPPAPSYEGNVNDERTIDPARHFGQHQHESPDPRPLRSGDTGGRVGSCPPQCPPESAPAETVPHRGVEAIPALPASVTTGPDESIAGTIEPVTSAPRHEGVPLSIAGPAARDIPSIRQILCDSQFPPRMEGILAKPMNKLSQKETHLLLDLLRTRMRNGDGIPSIELRKVMRELDFYATRSSRAMLSIQPMHPT
jgi:hypothetical protein